MCRGKHSPERDHAGRVTNEVLATSPDQANKRGLATSGESASALEGSAPAYNVPSLHPFSARRFVALGACGANKALELTGRHPGVCEVLQPPAARTG